VIPVNVEKNKLTDTHIKVYKYIKKYIEVDGLSPSYREIAAACEVSLSYSHKLVGELKDLGYVRIVWGKCRAIRI